MLGPERMCLRFRIFLFGLLCAVLFYPVANAYSETLEQAVKRALSGSPELNAGQLAVLETEEEKFRARSAWRPDVSLKIKGGRKQSTIETSTVPSDTTSFSPVSATRANQNRDIPNATSNALTNIKTSASYHTLSVYFQRLLHPNNVKLEI